MRLRALLSIALLGIMIIESLGIPIERELLRVKRKGEEDGESEGSRLHRRELTPLTSEDKRSVNEPGNVGDDKEFRRRRRFESDKESNVDKDGENYPNKMAARSSRSSREDKDVTARGFDRFILPKDDIQGNKQPAKRSKAASGSGLDNDLESSASGMWISDSAAEDILSGKVDRKRSTNSLESIVAALSAITKDHSADYDGENGGSASGAWVISGSGQGLGAQDDDLPKFFAAAASNSHYVEVGETISGSGSGTGENPVALKQGKLISDLAEEVHEDTRPNDKQPSQSAGAPLSDAKPSINGTKPIEVQKRDILEQFFGENHEDVLSRSRRNQVDKNVGESLTSFFRNNKPEKAFSEADLPIKKEPPPIPAVRAVKGGSKINEKSGSLESANGGDGLTGLSLVRRFYRDQNMEETGQTREAVPKKQNLEKEILAKKQLITKKVEEEVNEHHKEMNNPFEARVVYKKQLPKAHVDIIEEPAVYTKNEEEGMDSSDGGMNEEDSDESESTIEIHERDIREDGYVGCYADQSPDRDLPFAVSVRDLTPTTCRMACKETQHAYAGLQYGYLCRCGDSYGKYSRLSEDQCSTACKGDKTQICGGFFRSSVYATDGVTEPTQGDFFHVESVRPLNAAITEPSTASNYMPITSSYSSPAPYRTQNHFPYNSPVVQFAPSVQAPTYFTPDEPKVIIHSETPLPEYQAKPQPAVVKAQVVSTPVQRFNYMPSIIGNMERQQKKSTISRPPAPKVNPQGSRVSQLHYLHQQHPMAPKSSPQFQGLSHVVTTPGTKTFTGTIKLKQNWLDGLQNQKSAEFKILSGNLEQAFKKMFEKDPNFIKVKILGFNKGLVKHNPATLRKVIAPFVLTFKQNTAGIENRVTKSIQDTGKLFDMPVYKQSIHIQEYHEAPKPSVTKDKIVARKEAKNETKRSSVTQPGQPKVPYTLELFLLRDPGKIKRRTLPESK